MKVIPFSIPQSGREAIRVQADEVPYFYNHLHRHPEIQVTIITESTGTLVAGDYMGPFRAGDVFIIGSNQPHVFRNDEKYFKKKSRASSITVFFDRNIFGESFTRFAEMKQVFEFLQRSSCGFRVSGAKKKRLGEKMKILLNAKGLDRIIRFFEILKELASKKEIQPLASVLLPANIKDYDSTRLNRVISFTFTEYHRPVKLKEAASAANMTAEAFCKYFKTRTGKTYINFLNEVRINHACKLLETEATVAEISNACGFSNLSNFNRFFKRLKKKSPAEYRRLQYL